MENIIINKYLWCLLDYDYTMAHPLCAFDTFVRKKYHFTWPKQNNKTNVTYRVFNKTISNMYK